MSVINNSNESIVEMTFTLGYVVEDKTEDGWEIEVYPMQTIPGYSGVLTDDPTERASIKDAFGKNTDTIIKKDRRIKCTWLPLFNSSNRVSPPSVRKEETVLIVQFGNLDKYFWIGSIFADSDLRKNEKMITFLSNKQEKSKEVDSLENGYYSAIDTYNKYIKVHTSKNDGEYTTYDMALQTKRGRWYFKDGKGNNIELDSTKDTMYINMFNELYVNIKNYIEANTVDTVINSRDTITCNTTDYQHNASKTIEWNTTDTTLNSSSTITNNTTDYTLNATSTIKCNTVDYSHFADNSIRMKTRSTQISSSDRVEIGTTNFSINSRGQTNISSNGGTGIGDSTSMTISAGGVITITGSMVMINSGGGSVSSPSVDLGDMVNTLSSVSSKLSSLTYGSMSRYEESINRSAIDLSDTVVSNKVALNNGMDSSLSNITNSLGAEKASLIQDKMSIAKDNLNSISNSSISNIVESSKNNLTTLSTSYNVLNTTIENDTKTSISGFANSYGNLTDHMPSAMTSIVNNTTNIGNDIVSVSNNINNSIKSSINNNKSYLTDNYNSIISKLSKDIKDIANVDDTEVNRLIQPLIEAKNTSISNIDRVSNDVIDNFDNITNTTKESVRNEILDTLTEFTSKADKIVDNETKRKQAIENAQNDPNIIVHQPIETDIYKDILRDRQDNIINNINKEKEEQPKEEEKEPEVIQPTIEDIPGEVVVTNERYDNGDYKAYYVTKDKRRVYMAISPEEVNKKKK